jgi:short-subunit dehydrogenase
MLKQGSGAIVNISSIASVVSALGLSIYAASKAGMVALTKTAAP